MLRWTFDPPVAQCHANILTQQPGVSEMANNYLDSHQRILARKDDLLELVKEALRKAGLQDLDIKVIHVDITKRGPVCPAGQTAVWEGVPHPDGSIVFQWICK
jgi:hypothetical protein